ncbi:MAG: ABC transporter substrate-binding protein [Lachnospiraceae bacterium]|nr:ABC transporter substrate-binding protein [Lachnospiraceae bacterium]
MKRYLWKRAAAVTTAMVMAFGLMACGGDSEEKENKAVKATEGETKGKDETKKETTAGGSSESKGVIKIGVVGPITGTNAEDGIGFQVATEIAVDEINAAGGVAGYTLACESNDSASDANQSADITRQYAEDESFHVIIGDFTTTCCVVDAAIVDEYKIPMITPTASGTQLPGISDYFFTMSHTQAYEAPWAAKNVTATYLGAKRAAIMRLNTDWGNLVDEYMVPALEEAGVEVVADEAYLDTETNYSSIISKLNSANPDVIIVVDQSNASTIINQIRGAGIETQIQLFGPGAAVQIVDQTGEYSEGVITDAASLLTYDNEKAYDFMVKFKEKAGFDAADHAMCTYNAIYMIKDAIEDAVAAGETEVTREVIRTYLETAEFDSPIGLCKFNELHGSDRDLVVLAIEDGKYVVKCDYGYFD